jgi:hypothetical protein
MRLSTGTRPSRISERSATASRSWLVPPRRQAPSSDAILEAGVITDHF